MHKYAALVLISAVLLLSALLLNSAPIAINLLPASLSQELAGTEQAAAVFATATQENVGNLKLSFSHLDYFYNKTIRVEIFASHPSADIYYTTDGSEPTSASEKYSKSILLSEGRGTNVFVLKAIAVMGDQVSAPFVHTYFIGKDDRFDTLVFSVSTNPEYLYDYDTGIFVAGRLRDDFIAANPGADITPPDPANYNWRGMEGERPVYVEVFTPQGQRVIAQAAGMRVSGGWSREADQKSIRLIARKEYEPTAGKFHYTFFPGDAKADIDGTPITEYDTLILRNGANDRDFGMLRNEVASKLAYGAGFYAVTPVRAAAVFVNGEYYGFAWLEVNVNEQYLQDIYAAPTKDFQIVGDGEQWLTTQDVEAKASLEAVNSYASKNLRNDAIFAELESLVDVENLLFYYAYQIYMGNDDWPQNNLKRWRYTGPLQENAAPELDGRWRYILYDLDWTLGLYGSSYTQATFQNVLQGDNKRSPLLAAILTRQDMAERFSIILCDLGANVVTKEKVAQLINRLYGEAENEINKAFQAHQYASWVSAYTVADNHSNMLAYAEKRKLQMFADLKGYLHYGDYMYEIAVTGGEAIIGTQRGTAAKYFGIMRVPVSPALDAFEVFDHWLVNGKRVDEPNITVSAGDEVNGVVKLTLVKRQEMPALIFSQAYASSLRNGCVLLNTQDTPVNTEGYYISDSRDNLFRWALPAATIAPGKTLPLVGKGSKDMNDLLKIQLGFQVKANRVLYVSDGNGVVLHTIIVADE